MTICGILNKIFLVHDKKGFSAKLPILWVLTSLIYGNKAKKLAKYSELQDILGKELPINAARLKFMVLLMTSLIKHLWFLCL